MYCDSDVDFTRNVDHNFIDSGSDFLSEFDIGDGGGGREHLFCCDLYVWCFFCLFYCLMYQTYKKRTQYFSVVNC